MAAEPRVLDSSQRPSGSVSYSQGGFWHVRETAIIGSCLRLADVRSGPLTAQSPRLKSCLTPPDAP
jgi:hypothetical protein